MTKFQSLWSALCSVPNNYWWNTLTPLTPTYLSYNNKTLNLELFLHLIILALEMLQWLYSMQYCSVMIYSGAGVFCLTILKLQWIIKNQISIEYGNKNGLPKNGGRIQSLVVFFIDVDLSAKTYWTLPRAQTPQSVSCSRKNLRILCQFSENSD